MPIERFIIQRLWFGLLAATLQVLLSAAPSVYGLILYERAIPGRSYEGVILFGLLTLVTVAISVAIADLARKNLTIIHQVLEVVEPKVPSVQVVLASFRAHAVGDAIAMGPTLLLILALALAHWAFLPVVLGLVAIIYGATRLGHPTVAQGTLLAASVVAMAVSAALAISGLLSPGILVSAAFLMAAILRPVLGSARHIDTLLASMKAWRSLLRSGSLRIFNVSDAERDIPRGILHYAGTMIALVVVSVCIWVPGSVVLPGIVAPDGHAMPIKATVSSRVASLLVRDGDHVERDDTLLTLDADQYKRQLESVREQINLERHGILEAARDREPSVRLIERRVESIRQLVAKNLRPESDLVDAQLSQSLEAKEWAEREYQRKATLLRLTEREADLERTLSVLKVTAPRSGKVQQIETAEGAPVVAGDIMLTVVPDSMPVIEAKLEPVDRASVTEGALADIRIRTSKQRFGAAMQAKVRTISADRFDDGTFRVVLTPTAPIPLGTEIEVTIKGQPQTAAGWVTAVVSGSIRKALR